MESPEREEPNGALPASDRQAHPPPLQEVSNASAPLSAPLNVAGNVRFVATSGHPARVFALLASARSRPHRQSPWPRRRPPQSRMGGGLTAIARLTSRCCISRTRRALRGGLLWVIGGHL